MKMWNKLGYYRVDDIAAFFFAFAIIAIGVSAAVYGFYGQDIDIRGEEARVLNYKIYNILRHRDVVNLEVFEENFDLLDAANIDKNIFNNGDYYYRIKLLGGSEDKVIFDGNPDYGIECDLELADPESRSSDAFPICHLTIEKVNFGMELRILTASNQKGERI
jgi:hypothetical protein